MTENVELPKRLVRYMKEIIISNDDMLPTRISYPSVLTPDELADLKDTIAIWIRQLERQSRECGKVLDAVFGEAKFHD